MTQDSGAWWVERLTPPPSESTPPLFRRRSKVYSPKRRSVEVPLTPELSAAIEQASTAGPESLANLLLAGIAGVLHRYTGHDRIAVGTPVPAETGNGSEPNAVPIVTPVSGEAPFLELVEAVAESARSSYARSDHPLTATLQALGLEEVQNHHPLFSVVLRVPTFHDPLPDLRNDVTVELSTEAGSRRLDLHYNARLHEPDTIERFGRHIVSFLAAGLTDPTRPVGEIPYLDDGERRLLLDEWSGGAVELADGRCLHHLFEEQAERTPDWPALFFAGTSWTFDAVNRRANQLGHYLRQRGAGPGAQVGLCMYASADLLVGLLGVLKSGAAVVPLVPTFPPVRNAMAIQDAAMGLIVTESRLRSSLPQEEISLICLDELSDEIASAADSNPRAKVGGRDLAYVLFTSGSTGRPKGVAMEHRSLANLVQWQRERSEDPAGKRTLQRTSLGFDVSFQEIFSTWCFGGALVVAPDEVRDDVSQLPAFIDRHQIARIFIPPVALHQIAASAATQPVSLASLKEIIVAGEQLQISMPVIRFFRNIECRLDNQYGPTETHVITAYELTGPSTRWPALPPIGRPIRNARVYLLDDGLEPVPVGVPGEICAGGVPVARGYLGQDEMTARAFRDDPFSDDPQGRMYRTGDIGRFLPDGEIEFLGRRDYQVKIRGYRIELGEIEAILRQVPGVLHTAVGIHEDPTRGKELVAYVVTREPGQPAASTIRSFLLERLPGHMVPAPSAILHLDSMPLTPTGKIDRKALPAPEPLRRGAEIPAISRSETERQIATVWAKVLGFEDVGLHESFLDLGGHSLLGIQIVSQINDLYNIRLPLATLLRGTTVAQVAKQVERMVTGIEAGEAEGEESPEASTAPGPEPQSLVLPNGKAIVCVRSSEAAYLYLDVFEHRTYDRGGIRYPEKGCVFDVGANVGLFTLYALERSPGLRIFAFEPAPPLFEALRRNTQDLSTVSLFDVALSDHNGTARLTYYPTLTGMSSFYPDRGQEQALLGTIVHNLAEMERGDGIEQLLPHLKEYMEERLASTTFDCPLRTLSDVIAEQEVEVIDLLKIDVQKAELDVLRGIADEDWPRVRQVVVEAHDLDGRLDQVSALLRKRGYQVTVEQDPLHRNTVVHFVYAR